MPVWMSRGFFGRVWVSGLPPGLWLGVGWGLARGGFVEEPAIQDAKPVTHVDRDVPGCPPGPNVVVMTPRVSYSGHKSGEAPVLHGITYVLCYLSAGRPPPVTSAYACTLAGAIVARV